MSAVEQLAEWLSSVLTSTDAEKLGALLAPDLVDAAKAALKLLEKIEAGNEEAAWSFEVQNLQNALAAAGVES
jgi:hypothetical protein